MPVPSTLFAGAFRKNRLGLIYMIVMASMVYFASLAVVAETSMTKAVALWGQDLGGRLTVQIPPVAEEDAAQKAERIRQATAALMDMPDIAQVTLVPEEDAMRLLEPWIKDESLLKTLPLPTLIDVHVAPDKNLESAVLSERLKTLDADIEVDGPGEWFASLMRGINGLAFFAWGMIALTLAVLVLAIALVCRVVLALQHETIDLLHILGARDQDISRQFQNQILRLSALPAILGAVLAGLSAVGAIFLFHKMWDGLFIATSAWSGPFASLLVVPFGAVLIASFAARFFIFRFLRSKA